VSEPVGGAAPPRDRVPFPDLVAGAAFKKCLMRFVSEALTSEIDAVIPPENNHRFYHGQRFSQERIDGSKMSGGMTIHSAETLLKWKDVVDNRVEALAELIVSVVSQMREGFMESLYTTISRETAEVGNVVSGRDQPSPKAILEALRKVEFGVNRRGEVTRPQIHVHEDMAPKLIADLREAGKDFESEVEAIVSIKDKAAREREAQRFARYKNAGDPD
jgi:hypothetical protein